MKRRDLTLQGFDEFDCDSLLGIADTVNWPALAFGSVVKVKNSMTCVTGTLPKVSDEAKAIVPKPSRMKLSSPGDRILIQNRMRMGRLRVEYPDEGEAVIEPGEILELVSVGPDNWLTAGSP